MKKILVAPDFHNLAETHRMVAFIESFCEKNWSVYVLGKGTYDTLLGTLPVIRKYIPYDEVFFTPEMYITMHSIDEEGFDYFSEKDLIEFVEQERKIILEVQPDAILTGYRLTMSISARLMKVPIVWVMSAVMSDMYFQKGLATMPHGHVLMSTLIKSLSKEKINKFFCKNALRMTRGSKEWIKCCMHYNIEPFKSDIEIFRGDYNIMADVPFLFSEFGELPPYYQFSGPLLFQYDLETPKSVLTYQKKDKPVIFFCMGSSANKKFARDLIEKLCKITEYDIFIAGSNIIEKTELKDIPDNIIIERMLPISAVARVSDVTIIHGGQGTLYSTIMEGVPFVGIPFFCEQQYNMEVFERVHCGKVLMKSSSFEDVMCAVKEVIENNEYRNGAQRIGLEINSFLKNIKGTPAECGADGIIQFLENLKEDPSISYFSKNKKY